MYHVVLLKAGIANMQTALDLEHMICTTRLERTEDDGTLLLTTVRFKIVKLSRHARAVESLVEAELK
jgi:hypothetical protein